MPLYTPVGGSWLNMAESIQRILKRRALEGQHPQSPAEIIERLEGTAEGWNRETTPFEWADAGPSGEDVSGCGVKNSAARAHAPSGHPANAHRWPSNGNNPAT